MTAMHDDPNDYTIEDLQKLIAENVLQNQEDTVKSSELRSEIERIKSQYIKLELEKQTIDRARQVREHQNREFEKKLEAKRRLAEVEAEQKRLQELFDARTAELDKLTSTAYWREWAFDHQIQGGKKLALAKRGILADKRGLGKTLTGGVIALDMMQAKKVLVIAPNDVVPQFVDELRHWTNRTRPVYNLRGMDKAKRTIIYPILKMTPECVVMLNYEAWRRDKTIIDDLIEIGFDTLVLDEAHRIKSADKVTARGIFQVAHVPNKCKSCGEVSLATGPWEQKKSKYNRLTGEYVDVMELVDIGLTSSAYCPKCHGLCVPSVENVVLMTGTPLLNKPIELFSLLHLVNRDRWDTEAQYLRMYCTKDYKGKWKFLPGGQKRLAKSMSEFYLARTRDDAGITVPPPSVTVHVIEKDKVKYKAQYEAERILTEQARLLTESGTRKDVFFILEMILRERQMMAWPAGIVLRDPDTKEILCNFDVKQSQKMDEITELLLDLCEEGERTVVFSQFKPPLYELADRLRSIGIPVCMATGDQSEWERERVKNDFDLKFAPKGNVGEEDGPQFAVCLATYKAFGTGINLNAARQMILLDEEWNPGMEDQAIGRIDRLNSTDQANVHIFRVENSVDDFMAALLEEKRNLIEGFEGAIQTEAYDAMKNFFNREL